MQLNGFYVAFSSENFTLYAKEMPTSKDVAEMREQYGDEWYLRWNAGKVYGIPKNDTPSELIGEPVKVGCSEFIGLKVILGRLTEKLEDLFPKYETHSKYPYSFLARKSQIIPDILESLRVNCPVARQFEIIPRFIFEPKIIEVKEGNVELAVFLKTKMEWKINASLMELHSAGINLNGLFAVRKGQIKENEKRLVGRIDRIENEEVIFSESYDEGKAVALNDLNIEGSLHSFKTCFKVLLGSRYEEFNKHRFIQEGEFFTALGYTDVLNKMRKATGGRKVKIAPDLNCSISHTISLHNQGFKSVLQLKDVEYCYNPAKSKRHKYAWFGIDKYGPYGQDTIGVRSPSFLVVCPEATQGKSEQFIQKLLYGISSIDNSRFDKGFLDYFGFVNPEIDFCKVGRSDIETLGSGEAYEAAITKHLAEAQKQYSIALVFILNEDSNKPIKSSPYWISKSLLLTHGVAVQQIRHTTVCQPDNSLQYTLQNLSVALYAKLGGVPWTVSQDQTYTDELVIGMGTCEMSGNRFLSRQRFVGITTVFRGDGNYLLSNISEECDYDAYPGVLEDTMARVLAEIKARNAWQAGDNIKIVFHAFKPLKKIEISKIIERCINQVAGEQNIQFAFLTINHEHCFKVLDEIGVKKATRKSKGVGVPERGTAVHIGRYTRLLTITGPKQIKREATPLPSPLLIHWHPESTYADIDYLTEQVLNFTSLSWKSVHPTRAPVTILYSELIAESLVKLKQIETWSPSQLRTRLQASRWFL